jgi:hypothetical protein
MGWIDIGERVSNDIGSGERDTVELARAVAIPGARAPSVGILLSGPRVGKFTTSIARPFYRPDGEASD